MAKQPEFCIALADVPDLFLTEHLDGSRSWTASSIAAVRFSTKDEAETFAACQLCSQSFHVREMPRNPW